MGRNWMRDEDRELQRILLERGLLTPRELDEVLAEVPEMTESLGRLLVDKGMMGETRILELEKEVREAIQGGPSQWMSSAISALQGGRMEEAIQRLKEATRRDDGGMEEERRRLLAAEEALALAIERQPNNFEIWTQRGIGRLARGLLSTLKDGDPEESCKGALEDLTRAVALRPESSGARVNRANLLLFCARFARAVGKKPLDLLQLAMEDLDEACRLDPKSAAAFHARGTVRFYKAKEFHREERDADAEYVLAAEDFATAFELNPGDAYALKDLGVSKVALAKERFARKLKVKNLYEEAVGHLSRAIEILPGLYGAWYERGHSQFALKNFPEAIQDWQRAIAIDSTHAEGIEELIEQARTWIARRSPKS